MKSCKRVIDGKGGDVLVLVRNVSCHISAGSDRDQGLAADWDVEVGINCTCKVL